MPSRRRLNAERAERALRVAHGVLTEPHPLKHLGIRAPGRSGGPDFAGLTAPELAAVMAQPRWAVAPPRRVGHEAVSTVNALSGMLPTEAILLARLVADAAPPLGQPVSAALHDILDQYLPASLEAYRRSGSTLASTQAETLLVDQLRLLHQATIDIQRAEAEHNDHELRVQQSFLKERFEAPRRNGLDLTPHPPTTGGPGAAQPVPVAPAEGPVTSPATVNRRRLHVDHDSVTVLPTGDGDLTLRLAAPKGLGATLGVVTQAPDGAITFASDRIRRRVASRKQVGFTAAQADISLSVQLPPARRFLAYAVTRPSGDPTDVVLFVGAGGRAEVPTTLFRRRGATVTVVASGYLTVDGVFVRNESTIYPDLRTACTGFGFDQVSWISADTPVV